MTPRAVSVLKEADLIRDTREGKYIYYELNASVLEEIEGIGKKKRIALMEKFGTIDKIIAAREEDLATTDGIGEELAKKIYKFFREEL